MSYLLFGPLLVNLQSYENNLQLFARATCLVPKRFLRFSMKASKTQRHKGRLHVLPISPCVATTAENSKRRLGTGQARHNVQISAQLE